MLCSHPPVELALQKEPGHVTVLSLHQRQSPLYQDVRRYGIHPAERPILQSQNNEAQEKRSFDPPIRAQLVRRSHGGDCPRSVMFRGKSRGEGEEGAMFRRR